MADATTTNTKLRIKFKQSDGTTLTQNWSNTKQNMLRSEVKSFINTILTNNAVFAKVPKTVQSADEVTTTKVTYDLEG